MSEEIKNGAGSETGAGTGETPSGPVKKKKINKLTNSELLKKISEFETSNLVRSTYYKHLVTRKKELKI